MKCVSRIAALTVNDVSVTPDAFTTCGGPCDHSV